MEFALTTYPLSADFRTKFERVVGTRPTYLEYGELRSLSPMALLSKLRSLGASRLFLPIEDELSRCVLPLLKALAAVTDAGAIDVVSPQLRTERVSRGTLGRSLFELGAASMAGARDMAACRAEAEYLCTVPREVPAHVDLQRALYVNANLWFGLKAGGSIGHIAGVVNAMADEGRHVTLASPNHMGMVRPQVQQIRLDVPAVFGLPFEKSQYTFNRSVVRQLERVQDTVKPGFIYQRMSITNHAGVALSRRWGVPLVLEYNGSEVWIGKNWGRGFRYPEVALKAEQACLRHAHLVVTVSDVLADELVERGVERERIVWYPNCVDTTLFDPARFSDAGAQVLRARLNIPITAPLVTFIGTFGQWHGVEVFAQAIRQLVDHHRGWLEATGTRFLLVGDGPKMPAVRQALSDAPYAPFVTLTGLVPQAEAPQYLAAADVVVSPHVPNADGSRFFGSPTKLFEYMAMGKPIVASDLEQIGTILQNAVRAENLPPEAPHADEGRLAVLCEPGKVDALTAAVRFLIDTPAWRGVLGHNARVEAQTKYTWSCHVAEILSGLTSNLKRFRS
jgi:glycosyltransferase involved in cell wall biosynthesis